MSEQEIYNAEEMPLSNDPTLQVAQQKLLNGEELSFDEKFIIGRDRTIKSLAGYKFKPDHVYRAISEKTLEIYKKAGFIIGHDETDEYAQEIINGKLIWNNSGVDWYLGGACLRYGDIIIECPALKEYFTPIEDNGCGYSIDPRVRFLKSSGYKKPVPMSLVTSVMKVKVIPYDQILKAYEEAIKNPNIEVFINITKLVGYNDYSEYKMFIRDKTTGEEKLIQESIIDFTGRFNDILKKMYTLVTFNNPGLEGQSSEKVSWKSSEADRRIEFSGIDAYVLQELKEQFDQDKNSLDAEQISRHY